MSLRVEDTISILRGLKERYEVFHGVKITDCALVAAATLSHRYISDRFLPDKAIDLVDEACALIKTELDSMPTELDELRRRIMQMEIEEAALKKENRQSEQGASGNTPERSWQRFEMSLMARKLSGTMRRHSVENLSKLREQIEDMNKEIEKAKQQLRSEPCGRTSVWQSCPRLQQPAGCRRRKGKEQRPVSGT